jgi:SAM-dependent methyltransferase
LVIGADLSRDALVHARRHYAEHGTQFVRADGAGWLRAASLDGITSLETLEHVPDPAGLFASLVALLKPGGMLVASVPVTPSVDANPHHLSDFTERQFLRLGERHGLAIVARLDQVQRYSPVAVVARTERRTRGLRRGLAGYYLRHPGAFWRRIGALARFGFTNRYLTVAWRRERG